MDKATEEHAGCWIDGHWGQYGTAGMIEIAEIWGYADDEDIRIAKKHLACMGPSTSEPLTDDEWEHLMSAADDVESWFNDNIAPEGFSFGWHDGEFFLASGEWWDEA